jgi:hypothetical protein
MTTYATPPRGEWPANPQDGYENGYIGRALCGPEALTEQRDRRLRLTIMRPSEARR